MTPSNLGVEEQNNPVDKDEENRHDDGEGFCQKKEKKTQPIARWYWGPVFQNTLVINAAIIFLTDVKLDWGLFRCDGRFPGNQKTRAKLFLEEPFWCKRELVLDQV